MKMLNLVHVDKNQISFADILLAFYLSVSKDKEAIMFAGEYSLDNFLIIEKLLLFL